MQLPEHDVSSIMKTVAGALSSLAGIFLIWGKISSRMANGVRKDVDAVIARVDKIEAQTQKIREKILLIQKDVRPFLRVDKIETRVSVLETEQKRNIHDLQRISHEIARDTSPALSELVHDLNEQQRQLTEVRKAVGLQQMYLDEINRRGSLKGGQASLQR